MSRHRLWLSGFRMRLLLVVLAVLVTGRVAGADVPLRTLTGHTDNVLSVAFSPDGKILASGSEDGTIKLWDVAMGEEIHTLVGHTLYVTSVAFDPDGTIIASGSFDKTIKLWDVATGEEIRTLTGHSKYVVSVAFSPDGKVLASASSSTLDDNSVKLWDVATGREIRTLTHNVHLPTISVAFSPDGKILASGSLDKTIKLWDVATGQVIHTLTGHAAGVESVAFSPDGKILASGSLDKTIKLWDIDAASATQLPPLPASSPAPSLSSPRFSQEGVTNGVRFGSYVLRFTDVVKCVSMEHRPYASVFIGNVRGDRWVSLPSVVVDSGADMSLFPASVARALGIDLASCELKVFGSPGGGITFASLAKVQIAVAHLGGVEPDVDGYILASGGSPYLFTAQVAFSTNEANEDTYLLGRKDVFDSLAISFAGDTVTIRAAGK